jgi:hypothetical protein
MAGIGRAMHRTGEAFMLALEVCIPLTSLEQRQVKTVKNASPSGMGNLEFRSAITLG